jgi:hypothetical protein
VFIKAIVILALCSTPLGASAVTPLPSFDMREDAAPLLHATRGIVKAMDEHTLVIERFAHRGEMRFALTADTVRQGQLVVGATVSVRYRETGKGHVATAIALWQPAPAHH